MADGAEAPVWLTIPEVVQLLRLTSEQAGYRLAQRGQLPGAKKFGALWRVNRAELERTGSSSEHAVKTIRVGKG